MLNTPLKADVAILYDYDSLSSFRIQRQSILFDPVAEMQRLYKVFYDANIMVDIIPADRSIKDYKIVLVPQMIIMDKALTDKLQTFAADGGSLILTYRTSVKDRDNNLVLGQIAPVEMNSLAGVYVEETESLQDYNAFLLKECGTFKDQSGYGGIFRDMPTVDDAEVLYQYNDMFYQDYAAITKIAHHKGAVYYIGCTPDENTLCQVLETVIDEADIVKISSPDGGFDTSDFKTAVF